MSRPKIIKNTYRFKIDGELDKKVDKIHPESIIEKKEIKLEKGLPSSLESTDTFGFKFPDERSKVEKVSKNDNFNADVIEKKEKESISETQEESKITEITDNNKKNEESIPKASEKISYKKLVLNDDNLLQMIDELSKSDIYIEYGFFDNKYVIPKIFLEIFNCETEKIESVVKKLKSTRFLIDKQKGEIFAYPFLKKLVLTALGFERIA